MSAIAAIAIQDGKGTPATHTYNPLQAGATCVFRTADSALPLVGQESLQMRMKRINQQVQSVVLDLELPALETATGANSSGYTAAPKVGYTNRVKVEFFLPDRGTPAQRTDLRVLLKNLLANAQAIDFIDNLTPSY